MITVPDFQRIGNFQCLVSDNVSYQELEEIRNQQKDVSKFVVSSDLRPFNGLKDKLLSQFPQAEFIVSSPVEMNSYSMDGIVPRWIFHEQNVQKVMEGDYAGLRPVTAEVVPTLNCNFRCVQCSYSEPKKNLHLWVDKDGRPNFNFSHETHMTKQTMRIVLERLSQGGVTNVLFTGGGEPFMNAEVTLFGLKLAHRLGLKIGLYSNGSLLNQEIINQILECEPVFFRISIYGDRDSFSSYTRQKKGLFDRVLRNLQLLTQRKMVMKSSTQLGLSYLLHPYTMKGVEPVTDLLKTTLTADQLNQISFMRFTPAVNYFGKSQHSQSPMDNVFSYLEQSVKPKFAGTEMEIKPYYHRLKDLNGNKSYEQCRASGWYLEVGPGGAAYLCCEKMFNPHFQIGNLVASSVEQIFTGSVREQLIHNLKCEDCPCLCKPHELNKVFEEIEGFRKQGKLEAVAKWRQSILSLIIQDKFFAGKLNDYES